MTVRYPEGMSAVVSPRTGLVRGVVEFPAAAGDPAVFTALATASDPVRLGTGLSATPGAGVGLTAEAARWSAIGEVVERYSSSWIERSRLLFGSRDELAGERRLAEPAAFALFHPEQHAAGGLPFVPFDASAPVAWIEGRSLVDGDPTWVPAALTHLPYRPQFEGEAAIAYPTSNGLACGRSREEATRRALWEAVERDALMILWRNGLARPRVERFAERRLPPPLAERLARPGLDYTVVDMTTDLPLPARLCLLRDRSASPPMFVVGAAARPNPAAADLAAVLEAAHALKWMREQPPGRVRAPATADAIESFEDHTSWYAYGDHGDAFDFLFGDGGSDADGGEDGGDGAAGGVSPPAADLDALVATLAAAGLEPVAVELTTEDVGALGFHVVRVVVPGLQPIEGPHRWPFLGGRRLFEVPVRMGLRAKPATLDDLNPDPHPLP